jgi:NAD(P)-dependent dehydrogenase (short-subunit alcohol dehydrogenase family)
MSDATDEKYVLISGASTGIGNATSRWLAVRGWKVLAGVRRDEDGKKLQQASPSITAIKLDVTDPATISAAANTVRELAPNGLAALINNAGIGVGGPIEFVPLAGWRTQFEVNLFGAIALTQAMLPLLRQRVETARAAGIGKGSARIVMVSSILGKVGSPISGPYSASKFAMEGASESLSIELHAQGIDVVLIEPGAIATPIWTKEKSAIAENEKAAREIYGDMMDAHKQMHDHAATNAIPPEKVAAAIERALTARRPKMRYPVGKDARLGVIFKRLLPDRWFEAAMRRALKFPKR